MPDNPSVESLLQKIEEGTAGAPPDFELWVPDSLTLGGVQVAGDVAIAVLLDRLLAKNYMPASVARGVGGCRYRYRRERQN
jgi:hypothetical protein